MRVCDIGWMFGGHGYLLLSEHLGVATGLVENLKYTQINIHKSFSPVNLSVKKFKKIILVSLFYLVAPRTLFW